MPRYRMNRMMSDDTLLPLYPETQADVVNVNNSSGHYQGSATNTQAALEELYSIASTGGVTSINGRSGSVTLSSGDVGLSNIVNEKQVIGLSSGTTQGHLVTWGSDGYHVNDAGVSIITTLSSDATDSQIPTGSAIVSYISNLPAPMVFKGTLGTGGTITSLPAASSSNVGHTYKVITAGTYQSIACDVGDVLTSNGSEWVLIPAGDEEFNDTWRPIYTTHMSNGHLETSLYKGNGINTGGITFYGDTPLSVYASRISIGSPMDYDYASAIIVKVASNYWIPTSTQVSSWNAKYDKPSTGIPASDLESGVQSSLSLANTALQHNETITLTGDITGSGSTTIATTLKTIMSGSTTATTPSNWQVVAVNSKGLVTAGNDLIEYGTSTANSPTSYLAVGGLFFSYIGE